ncbi:P-loop containing nucleoside triphosphate hydrolase protein [Peniophora sp. CONT]|nr:P-loop containing nucleoside triphosphate hydrolase protein [Peniophora sp. CONT]
MEISPPRGVLLHGPPGCGKTLLANAIGGVRSSRRACLACLANRRRHCMRGFAKARYVVPCLLFIDEIHTITSKRESAQREMERRIVHRQNLRAPYNRRVTLACLRQRPLASE